MRNDSVTDAHRPSVFASFFQGGFECSTHRRHDGRRLDLLAATGHDRWVAADFQAMRKHGLGTVRDGVRWHLIESSPGHYDWSSFLPMLQAARAHGMEVIWDLCHYGWPDFLDIWSGEFVDRFARFSAAVAQVVLDTGFERRFYCPVNEISYWAWAGGDMAEFNPCARGRGGELKRQLVRAAIAATDAIRAVDPQARFVAVDPVINVIHGSDDTRRNAFIAHTAQFESWDMLAGRVAPELGGHARYLDILGVNYYPHNQWVWQGATVPLGDIRYRPFRDILADVHRRYGRPILIAETGAEGDVRVPWLSYIGLQVAQALERGIPVEGVCLYPVLDYPGWCNDRHCDTGLLGLPDDNGHRPLYKPLALELATQQSRLQPFLLSESAAAGTLVEA